MIVGRSHTERTGCLVGTDEGGPILSAGDDPCVVAFHGFTGTTSEIRPVLERVLGAGYAVHAPLLPGHGTQPASLQEQTWEAWVTAMEAELRVAQRRHRKIVLLGFSLGSLVALELAARNPDKLVGLVVLGNAISLTPPVEAALAFVDKRGWKLPDWYLLKMWSADVRDREQKKRIASYDRDPLRAALEVYRAGRHVAQRLADVRVPTLICHGAKDRVCPVANASFVAERLGTKDVTTKVYRRSAHLVGADVDRTEVAGEVLRFVDRLAGT
jgi:carboxylesterase